MLPACWAGSCGIFMPDSALPPADAPAADRSSADGSRSEAAGNIGGGSEAFGPAAPAFSAAVCAAAACGLPAVSEGAPAAKGASAGGMPCARVGSRCQGCAAGRRLAARCCDGWLVHACGDGVAAGWRAVTCCTCINQRARHRCETQQHGRVLVVQRVALALIRWLCYGHDSSLASEFLTRADKAMLVCLVCFTDMATCAIRLDSNPPRFADLL